MAVSRLPDEAGFGLYIHWPFCLSKCPYCDFNSHVAATIDQARWRQALVAALRRAAKPQQSRVLSSIFFGGGTPSLMDPQTTAALIDEAAQLFALDPALEVTLEANPTSVESERFRSFRAAGVNRVSIGVQALEDAPLRFLGRHHSAREALDAVAQAQRIFPRVSFDLIYARPGQTEASWADELAQALAIGTDHLSLYQLTYEEGTPFGTAHARGRLPALDEERSARLFELTQTRCSAAGLPAYEISNHARPGSESRHNLIYWRYGTYLGIGPGAHGRVDGCATVAHRAPGEWLAAVEAGGEGSLERLVLTPQERAAEYLLMALRLREGLSLARYEALNGAALEAGRLDDLLALGLLCRTGDRIAATPRGRLVLNQLIAQLANT